MWKRLPIALHICAYSMRSLAILFPVISSRFFIIGLLQAMLILACCFSACFVMLIALCWIISVMLSLIVSTVCHYVWCCEPVLKLELERVGPTSLFLSFGCQLLPMFTVTQPINILRWRGSWRSRRWVTVIGWSVMMPSITCLVFPFGLPCVHLLPDFFWKCVFMILNYFFYMLPILPDYAEHQVDVDLWLSFYYIQGRRKRCGQCGHGRTIISQIKKTPKTKLTQTHHRNTVLYNMMI